MVYDIYRSNECFIKHSNVTFVFFTIWKVQSLSSQTPQVQVKLQVIGVQVFYDFFRVESEVWSDSSPDRCINHCSSVSESSDDKIVDFENFGQ